MEISRAKFIQDAGMKCSNSKVETEEDMKSFRFFNIGHVFHVIKGYVLYHY